MTKKSVDFCAAGQDAAIDWVVLAQFTQLYMTAKLECPFYKVKGI